MNEILKLHNVDKAYNAGAENEVKIFQNLNLSIQAGELVALVAPSGTGKTTLLNIAGLLDSPDAGSISILGRDTGSAKDSQRTKIRREDIGFVYQFHHLLPEFSALENVIIPQLVAGKSRAHATKRATELLEKLGLSDRFNHRPVALSGGEAQRVAIARALANKPKLLLADEPTGNLDGDNSDIVFEILLEIARSEGLAALIATHNMDLAKKLDRIYWLAEEGH